ncbi:hypothetical protein PIB30_049486 [Stylosanthes scabra]|uniref:BTB domain-containing protein n=1 Tax=Stylosanthes scabra TaxID=79078 RepID=A0ABU6RHP1_9FABA|nr:hypothetical protein [Stylosanthes scabra]
MPPRRFAAASAAVNEVSDMDSDGYDEEAGEEEEPFPVKCRSCDEEYEADDARTCKACYENANENQEKLKREIDDLKSKVSFLKLPSPSQDSITYGHNVGATDVVLVPSGDPSAPAGAGVPAHRVVLAIRSPVFKGMLENDMKESRSGTINVSDIKCDTLREFVNYLYTAEATLDDHKAHVLLMLGEKYQVNHLKEHCEKHLISSLNWDNAMPNYTFACSYNAKILRKACLKELTANMEMLKKNEMYPVMVQAHPQLVVDIYEYYLSKQPDILACLGRLFLKNRGTITLAPQNLSFQPVLRLEPCKPKIEVLNLARLKAEKTGPLWKRRSLEVKRSSLWNSRSPWRDAEAGSTSTVGSSFQRHHHGDCSHAKCYLLKQFDQPPNGWRLSEGQH